MKRMNVLLASAFLSIGLAQFASAENRAGAPSTAPCTAAELTVRSQPSKATGIHLAQVTPPPCGNCTLPSGQRGNIVRGVCSVCENR
jgi:hypothetical protein